MAPFLGGLRTTAADEYGFWTVSDAGVPSAVPPFSLAFSTSALLGHALLAADEDGVLTVLDTRRSLAHQMHVPCPADAPPARFRAHDNAVFDAVWLPGDAHVASASGDASARVFDVQTTLRLAQLRGHAGSVKAVRSLPGSPHVLVTAARDGHVRAFDTRAPSVYDPAVARDSFHTPVFQLSRPHAPPAPPRKRRRRPRAAAAADPPPSVTALAFAPHAPHLLFTAGASDGTVKLWDVRGVDRRRPAGRPRAPACCVAEAAPGAGAARSHGIASLDVDPSGRRLAVSATDSTVYVYDAADLSLGWSRRLVGHAQTSFYIRARFSPCGDYVLSGSADASAYIWDLAARPGPAGALAPALRLAAHRGGEAAGVAWCAADALKVATCGDDATARVWRVRRGLRALPAPADAEPGVVGAAIRPREDAVRRRAARPAPTLDARAVKAGVKRRRLVDADIRSFFKEAPPTAAAQS